SSVSASESRHAHTARAGLAHGAMNAAPTAVARVKDDVDANAVAECQTSWALAARPGAAIRCRSAADVSASAAVVAVELQVDAIAAAQRQAGWTRGAGPLAAVGRPPGADVSAGAAVVKVRVQEGACPVAADGAFDAGVIAVAVDARAVLVGTGRRTRMS